MKTHYIAAFVAAACGCHASAQEVLSLSDCRTLALQNNKEIAAAAKQTEAADYTVRSLRSNSLPSISLRANGIYSNANGQLGVDGGLLPVGQVVPQVGQWVPGESSAYFPGLNLEYEVGPVLNASLVLEQPIYMGGKINAANQMARLGREVAQSNEVLTQQNVVLQTSKAYALLVRAKEMKKVADKYHELLSQLMKNVEKAYELGYKPHNDVLRVQVKLNEAALNVRKASNAIRLAQMNLCHYIGQPLDANIEIAEGFPSGNESVAEATDILARPEFAMLDRQEAIANQKVRLQRAEALPQVALLAGYGYTNGVDLTTADKTEKLFDKASFAVLLNVQVPLYHFGQNHNKTRAALAQRTQVQIERESKTELMTLELTQARNNFDEAVLQSALAQKNLEQAEENLRASSKQYEAGSETLSDHLEAQVLWQKAYQTNVDALFEQYISQIALQKATGKLSVDTDNK